MHAAPLTAETTRIALMNAPCHLAIQRSAYLDHFGQARILYQVVAIDYLAAPVCKRVNVAAGEYSGVLDSGVDQHDILARNIGKYQVRPVEDRHVVFDVDDRTNPRARDRVPLDTSIVLVFEDHQASIRVAIDYVRIAKRCAARGLSLIDSA
jgi:hypothetical protein